eukprot:5814488-Prymnesium_polylepis.1
MRQTATRDFQATRPHLPPCKAQGRYEMRCDCAMRYGRRRAVWRVGKRSPLSPIFHVVCVCLCSLLELANGRAIMVAAE